LPWERHSKCDDALKSSKRIIFNKIFFTAKPFFMSKSSKDEYVATTVGGSGRGGGGGPRKLLKPILFAIILLGILYVAVVAIRSHEQDFEME